MTQEEFNSEVISVAAGIAAVLGPISKPIGMVACIEVACFLASIANREEDLALKLRQVANLLEGKPE